VPFFAPVFSAFWLQATADVTSLTEIQGQMADDVQRACGVPLRLADLLLRAMALALTDCPRANRVWQGETCVELKTADVGIEVDLPAGRAVAVVRQADRLRLVDLVSRRAELTELARAGGLPPEAAGPAATSLCDLTDFAIDQCAAVLLPPRTSVLAAVRPRRRCQEFLSAEGLRQGETVWPKKVPGTFSALSLSLTADPHAVAPETAATWLARIVELIEHPFLLLCERLPR
jgi:pyruvate dehydrogenase E2 component (dihydrolipoamide acetyltransferase)